MISSSRPACSGNRNTSIQYGIVGNNAASLSMKILAGVTANVSANRPQAANLRVGSHSKATAPAISSPPLTRTTARGQGM